MKHSFNLLLVVVASVPTHF